MSQQNITVAAFLLQVETREVKAEGKKRGRAGGSTTRRRRLEVVGQQGREGNNSGGGEGQAAIKVTLEKKWGEWGAGGQARLSGGPRQEVEPLIKLRPLFLQAGPEFE